MTPTKLDRRLRWQEFTGLTALLEPNPIPGSRSGTLAEISAYRRLDSTAADVAAKVRSLGAPLLRVPWWTYHVTFCDLINDANVAHASHEVHEIRAVLRSLPGSPASTRLVTPEWWPVGLFEGLSLSSRGLDVRGRVLIVDMVPDNTAAMAAALEARAALGERLLEATGIASKEWRPHLTLGYWPAPPPAEISDVVRKTHVAEQTTFALSSCGLYGFMDMVTYWRL